MGATEGHSEGRMWYSRMQDTHTVGEALTGFGRPRFPRSYARRSAKRVLSRGPELRPDRERAEAEEGGRGMEAMLTGHSQLSYHNTHLYQIPVPSGARWHAG